MPTPRTPKAKKVAVMTNRERAERIATCMFTNGMGDVADRLALVVDGPKRRDLGGWGRAAFIEWVEHTLDACAAEARASAKGK
jgi:hypothetical protein